MPTARELLEQADALMRRNRSVRVDTEATPPPSGTTAVIAPEPLPVAMPSTDTAPVAEAAPTPEAVPRALSLDDIPVLTDVVEEIEAPTIQEESWDGGEPTDWGEFDIIEEIEAPSIVDLPEDGGEPSGWGSYDGEPTIGGGAPESLIVVPPVTYFREGESRRGAAFGARARAAAAAEAEADTETKAEPEEPGASGVLVVDESLVHARLLATEGAGEPLVAAVASSGAVPLPAEDTAAALPGSGVAAGVPSAVDALSDDGIVTLYDVVSADESVALVARAAEPAAPPTFEVAEVAAPIAAEPLLGLAAPIEPTPIEPTASLSVPEPMAAEGAAVAPGVALAVTAPDAARWDSLAEEIRMQVLQRIDMFTDAGMQDQLRARLQPIVDRASADLVDTINQHVGQLLRTYVAEAIEREIDKWRGAG